MARYHACVTSVATTQAIGTLLHIAMPTDIHIHHFIHISTSEFQTSTVWSSNFQAWCCAGMLFVSHILSRTTMPYQYSITHYTVLTLKNPTRCNSVSKFLLFLILNEAQHVSIETPPIIRSLKLHWQPLVLHTWRVIGRVVAGRWQRPAAKLGLLDPSRRDW